MMKFRDRTDSVYEHVGNFHTTGADKRLNIDRLYGTVSIVQLCGSEVCAVTMLSDCPSVRLSVTMLGLSKRIEQSFSPLVASRS